MTSFQTLLHSHVHTQQNKLNSCHFFIKNFHNFERNPTYNITSCMVRDFDRQCMKQAHKNTKRNCQSKTPRRLDFE